MNDTEQVLDRIERAVGGDVQDAKIVAAAYRDLEAENERLKNFCQMCWTDDELPPEQTPTGLCGDHALMVAEHQSQLEERAEQAEARYAEAKKVLRDIDKGQRMGFPASSLGERARAFLNTLEAKQ